MIFQSRKGGESNSHTGTESTNHWINQRVTSVLLLPLTIFFVFIFIRAIDKTFVEVLVIFQHPFNNLVALLFLLISVWHYRQGIEVVIEDYIHDIRIRNLTLRAFGIICWFLSIVILFSFISIYTMEI